MSARFVWCLVVCASLSLAACGRDPDHDARKHASAGVSDQLTDSASADKYRVTIHYPALPAAQAPLAEALRAFGDHAKHDFLATFDDPAALPQTASYPWEMTLDFKVVAQTADFVSVIGQGDSYTGGAHGNPILASFTYDIGQDRVITLDDLFADMHAGLGALAGAARADLDRRTGTAPGGPDTEWIATGTAPTAANYQVFSVIAGQGRATGLKLWFAPYQVASYAEGVQTVEVPAAAFAAQLKPERRAAFVAAGAP